MKSFKQFNEVAPPGWGHTKAEKEKTDPSKPKSKIGGTAAAFKRALDRGDFKGLPGDKTKKEKTASMFKLMWSMKKKGDKPHYKPGTDKKYKKYQEEDKKDVRLKKEGQSSFSDKSNTFTQEEASYNQRDKELKKTKKAMDFRHRNIHKGGDDDVNESLSVKDTKKLAKASALSHSDDPKDQDRARARQVEIDYKDLMSQRKKKKVGVGKSMREEKKSCPEGEYYCFDMGKCRPIPDGHKVREDGELVKEEVYRGKGVGQKVDLKDKDTDNQKAGKEAIKSVARGVGKVAGHVVRKAKSERDAVVGVGKSIRKKEPNLKQVLQIELEKVLRVVLKQ